MAKTKAMVSPRSNTLFSTKNSVFSKWNGMSKNGNGQISDYQFSREYRWRNGKDENEDAAPPSFGHEAHSWRRTVCYGLFEDEAVSFGALHKESAMLHCSAHYVLSDDQLIEGLVHLTNYLLYFLPKERRSIPGGQQHLIMPIASIARISEQQKNGNCTEIAIIDRWYRPLRFRFVMDKEVQFMPPIAKVLQMARALTFPNRMIDLFAFEYFKDHPAHSKLVRAKSAQKQRARKERKQRAKGKEMAERERVTVPNGDSSGHDDVVVPVAVSAEDEEAASTDVWGWTTYDMEAEYGRMGVFPASASTSSSSLSASSSSPSLQKSGMKRHRHYTSGRMPSDHYGADDGGGGAAGNGLNGGNDVVGGDDGNSLSSGYRSAPRYRFSSVNAGYSICDSYPERLVVPSSITDWELTQCARFRRLGRIPIMSWKAADCNVALFRCSQPKVAMASNRSRADEHLIASIAESNPFTDTLYIMDARPKLNARANRMRGGGFENTNFYKNVILEFLNIENIHIMRKSRKSLSNLIHSHSNLRASRDKEWLQSLGSTEWLCHIRELLRGTVTMIRCLTVKKSSVCCHCSDGWDRTSQLCSLVQLCLDSYYRTMKGFIVLIEKEWLSVGHQFEKRCGHRRDDSVEEDERSPVFEQFIECSWQLMAQFPTAFEFDEQFLICILDHLYSARYGTFLCDKLKERLDYKLPDRTMSLWTHLQNSCRSEHFVNVYYRPTASHLIPKYSLKVLQFWKSWHLRHCPEHIMKPRPMYTDHGALELRHRFTQILRQNERLRKQIEAMRKRQNLQNHKVGMGMNGDFDRDTASSATPQQQRQKQQQKAQSMPMPIGNGNEHHEVDSHSHSDLESTAKSITTNGLPTSTVNPIDTRSEAVPPPTFKCSSSSSTSSPTSNAIEKSAASPLAPSTPSSITITTALLSEPSNGAAAASVTPSEPSPSPSLSVKKSNSALKRPTIVREDSNFD